jgi:hypothetical protein
MGSEGVRVSSVEGLASGVDELFCARRRTRLITGEEESSERLTLEREVEEGLEPFDEAVCTSGSPGGGAITRLSACCAVGGGVVGGRPDLGDVGAESFRDWMLDFELEKSASGTARFPLCTRSEAPSVDARGRTPISVRGSTIESAVSSG